MSTPTVINSSNSPTDVLYADYMAKASMAVLKKHRFDYGKGVCMSNMLEALFLGDMSCGDICYLDEEDKKLIRGRLIQISILDLNDL